MPLLSSVKNPQPEDWILIVSPGHKMHWFNSGHLSLYLLRYDAYAHRMYPKEPSSFSILRGEVYPEGFIEDHFSYQPPDTNHGIFSCGPFAVVRGKPPIGAYAHRKLLRRIASTYSHVFYDMVMDAWHDSLRYWK